MLVSWFSLPGYGLSAVTHLLVVSIRFVPSLTNAILTLLTALRNSSDQRLLSFEIRLLTTLKTRNTFSHYIFLQNVCSR